MIITWTFLLLNQGWYASQRSHAHLQMTASSYQTDFVREQPHRQETRDVNVYEPTCRVLACLCLAYDTLTHR